MPAILLMPEDMWIGQQPRQSRVSRLNSASTAFAFVPLIFGQTVKPIPSVSQWFPRARPPIAHYSYLGQIPNTAKERTTPDKWLGYLPARIVTKPFLPASQQQACGIDPNLLTLKESVSVDRWQGWKQDRIILQPRLATGLIPSLSFVRMAVGNIPAPQPGVSEWFPRPLPLIAKYPYFTHDPEQVSEFPVPLPGASEWIPRPQAIIANYGLFYVNATIPTSASIPQVPLWYPRPLFRAIITESGFIRVVPAEMVTIDKWAGLRPDRRMIAKIVHQPPSTGDLLQYIYGTSLIPTIEGTAMGSFTSIGQPDTYVDAPSIDILHEGQQGVA